MSSPVTPMIGPPCLCGEDPCICFVNSEGVTAVVFKRPRKTPLFVPPPAPDGYAIQRRENFSNWVHVSHFHDQSRNRKVKVLPYYDSRVTAEKVAKRMRETSWHKNIRVVEFWYKLEDRPQLVTMAVAELMTIAKKVGVSPVPGLKTSTGVISLTQVHDEIILMVADKLGKEMAKNLNQMLEEYEKSGPLGW